MSRSGVKVEGADSVQDALKSLGRDAKDLKAAHKAAAELVADDAKPRARRKSGRMAASVRAAGQAKQGVVRAGFARLAYVPVQHYGHPARNISPNPFLYEASDARRGDVLVKYEETFDRMIEENGLD